jgi:peptide subunit release factor 1 (eRF1)
VKVKVSYCCPNCSYRYTETLTLERKGKRDCKSCGEPDVLVIELEDE